jgi:DNA invertase Pin-like site-specific DNA recombinase
MTTDRVLRCAIYTRKSSEEGLEQSFNSLHAQREACEAYIKSQAGEGWALRRGRYDDAGYSGGKLERPALRQLLDEVTAGRIDVVVVYKVDRLTRSLADFAKIIDTFDNAGVAFVSVTQAFNTTTSMGRLTLNVLLSFAQFEREVTGERIRDKIAASKAKGMWMGGIPPLGYDPPVSQDSRALVVNEPEAKTVRLIFRRYLELGNTLALQRWLFEQGVRSKRWMSTRGRQMGGHPFSRGALQHLLRNRTYLGEIVHKGTSHPGRHPPAVDQDTFGAAQALLARNSKIRRTRIPKAAAALLYGRLFDCDGQLMEPIITTGKRRRIYRYYASSLGPRASGSATDDAIRRVPAAAIEELILRRLSSLCAAAESELVRDDVRALVARVEIHATAVHVVLWTKALGARSAQRMSVDAVRRRLQPGEQVTTEPSDTRKLRLHVPIRLKVRGGRNWVLGPDGHVLAATPPPDKTMIQRVRSAHAILRACGAHPDARNEQLRYARAPRSSHQMRRARWAFLAPDIQRSILEGRALTGSELSERADATIPLLWSEQRALLQITAKHQ